MTTTLCSRVAPLLVLLGLTLVAGCSSLQGSREGPFYHAPAAAYTVDLGINTFRGNITLDERCDNFGGSTTFWDGSGRMFRIDYLKAEGNPSIRIPRFASDRTLLDMVLNGYLRSVVSNSPLVLSTEVAHREFMQDQDPRALFTIASLEVKNDPAQELPEIAGLYYYGFLVFKKGELIYVVQHRQPALMPEHMKGVLLRMADSMDFPGKMRSENEVERTRRFLAKITPGLKDGGRLCTFPDSNTR